MLFIFSKISSYGLTNLFIGVFELLKSNKYIKTKIFRTYFPTDNAERIRI